MTYYWTKDDIKAGRYVWHPREGESCGTYPLPDGRAVSNRVYQIGFVHGGGRDNLVIISVVDGMVSKSKSDEAWTVYFNEDGYAPLPHKLLLAVVDSLRDAQVAQ